MTAPTQEAFDVLTARMQSIYVNAEAAPEAHAPIHLKALEGSYLRAAEYLRENPELAETYAKLGEIALSADQAALEAQELSVTLMKKYVEDGLIAAEEIEEAVNSLAATKEAIDRKEDFASYSQLFADIKLVKDPRPNAPAITEPAPEPPQPQSPQQNRVSAPAETPAVSVETEQDPNIRWRRPSIVDAMRVGIMSQNRVILVGDTELHKDILDFAIRSKDPHGFTMEQLRNDVPSIRELSDAEYHKLKIAFPGIREQIVGELLAKKVHLRWPDNGGTGRGKRYWLEIGFSDDSTTLASDATEVAIPASTPAEDQTPATAVSDPETRRAQSDVLFTRGAEFANKLTHGIAAIIEDGPQYSATKPKYVVPEVARLLDTSLATAEAMIGDLVTAGHVLKGHDEGSTHYSVDLESFNTTDTTVVEGFNWEDFGKDDLTVTEQDCAVAVHVFETLGKAGDDFTSIWDFRGDLEKVTGTAPTYEDILLFMDKLKSNGFIHMQHTDVGKKRKPLQARFNGWALERWHKDSADLLKEFKEDSKRPGETIEV